MKRERSALEDDSSGSFFAFQRLCDKIGGTSSYTEKTNILKDHFNGYNGDLYLMVKLLLCKNDQRVFRLGDKAILKIFASVLCGVQKPRSGESLEDLNAELNKSGDASMVCCAAWARKSQKWSTFTLKDVDEFLESLTQLTKKAEQIAAFSEFLEGKATSDDVKWLVRLIKQDLWINIGPKYVLNALHPNAFGAWKKSNNLQKIVQKIQIHGLDDDDEDDDDGHDSSAPKKKLKKAFSETITIGTPIKPMLAKATKVSTLFSCLFCSGLVWFCWAVFTKCESLQVVRRCSEAFTQRYAL